MARSEDDYLALFLGPMAENHRLVSELVEQVLQDHVHWRRNYFPGDRPPLSVSEQREQIELQSELHQAATEMLAKLRASIPFHSPRYIGHQQSETTIMSLIGVLAGLLYNSNNVTPESGVVTVELELEGSARLLTMLGLRPPPQPPKLEDVTGPELTKYTRSLEEPFGWCHLTSGGTTANMEALWVARNVHYRPLAIGGIARGLEADWCRAAAAHAGIKEKLGDLTNSTMGMLREFEVHMPNGTTRALGTLNAEELTRISPAESMRLMRDTLAAAGEGAGNLAELFRHVADLELRRWLADHPVCIYVAGTAHYSVKKAADLLGLSRSSIEMVPTDSRHRLDTTALGALLRRPDAPTPLAVVAILGTTEEGAFDPLDEILDVRAGVESELDTSFWIHADGAWGGYFATVLQLDAEDEFELAVCAAADANGFEAPEFGPPRVWLHDFFAHLADVSGPADPSDASWQAWLDLEPSIRTGDFVQAADRFATLVEATGGSLGEISDELRKRQLAAFMESHTSLTLTHPTRPNRVQRPVELGLDPSDGVFDALHALRDADSVTVDPHKMGYQHYPCGAVAFADDTSRHYISEAAPYITSLAGESPRFQPLRRIENDKKDGTDNLKPITEAAATFTLEGSRPSFPAAALHLAERLLPLNQSNHGRVVRSAWLAAQELYHWLLNWTDMYEDLMGESPGYRLVTLARNPHGQPVVPDTNLVIFGVTTAREVGLTLDQYEQVNKAVASRFKISAEGGEAQSSYSQKFFLSTTPFKLPSYPEEAIAPIASAANINDFATAYPNGAQMTVLRSSVMNPYIEPMRRRGKADLLREFMWELHEAASTAIAEL